MSRILLIDDEELIRNALKIRLGREGYEVVTASDGKIGIETYRSGQFDLVITDIFMPEKDGIETIMELRKDFPEIKIIAMSGGGEHFKSYEFLEQTKALGALWILKKPVDSNALLTAIKEAIG